MKQVPFPARRLEDAKFSYQEHVMADIDRPDLTTLTVQLLIAYFANNSVPSGELADLIEKTHAALERRPAAVPIPIVPATVYKPAVTQNESLASPEHILSMIDGKPYKTLSRHLSRHGLTPAEYRARYALPADYPLVSPAYSNKRREVAKRLGLGRRTDGPAGASQAATQTRMPEQAAEGQAPVAPAISQEANAAADTMQAMREATKQKPAKSAAVTAPERIVRKKLGIAAPKEVAPKVASAPQQAATAKSAGSASVSSPMPAPLRRRARKAVDAPGIAADTGETTTKPPATAIRKERPAARKKIDGPGEVSDVAVATASTNDARPKARAVTRRRMARPAPADPVPPIPAAQEVGASPKAGHGNRKIAAGRRPRRPKD